MMAFTPFTGAVFVAHMVAGIVLGYSLLKMIESSIPLAAVYGILYTGVVVAVDAWVGRRFLELTWMQFEAAVFASVLGGILGLITMFVLFEAETRSRRVDIGEMENKNAETEVAD